jgi:tRNA pseudouridine38-40 synthase
VAARFLKLVIAYDGTRFSGWQRQPAGVSIQGLLEEALARIEGRPVVITGAGRTDAGVHALGQVASCRLEHPLALENLQRALNAMLPPDVRVRRVEGAPEGFHARYDAVGKTYRYAILNGTTASPFLRHHAWHVPRPLDVEAMASAAGELAGTHDFAAFRSTGGSVKTTIRTITASTLRTGDPAEVVGAWRDTLEGTEGRLVVYEVSATGFLRHMVRAIVGSLVEVGSGRREPAWMATLVAGAGRDEAGPTAPAHGLWLVRVDYQLPPLQPCL